VPGKKNAESELASDLARRDEEIRLATVGERAPLNSTIHLAAYDPTWPGTFTREAVRIREGLGGKVLLLEHVGSTSVPGLCAKPVIDMLLAVENSADEASYGPALESEGYALRIREPDWFEHRCFKLSRLEGNLHIFSAGCPEIDRMLLFRDWLRREEDDRLLYEGTKRKLAAQKWKFVQHYADAKSKIVKEILARASDALADTGLTKA
jgi:GrpB-like predicted nucleotidyltransferase (UPF0157 family)